MEVSQSPDIACARTESSARVLGPKLIPILAQASAEKSEVDSFLAGLSFCVAGVRGSETSAEWATYEFYSFEKCLSWTLSKRELSVQLYTKYEETTGGMEFGPHPDSGWARFWPFTC